MPTELLNILQRSQRSQRSQGLRTWPCGRYLCGTFLEKTHSYIRWLFAGLVSSYAPVPVPTTTHKNDNGTPNSQHLSSQMPEPTLWRPRSFIVRSAMKLRSFTRLCSAGMVLHHVSSFVAKPALSSSATANAKIVSFDVTCFTCFTCCGDLSVPSADCTNKMQGMSQSLDQSLSATSHNEGCC